MWPKIFNKKTERQADKETIQDRKADEKETESQADKDTDVFGPT